jgi:hypothetical protein
MVDAQGDRVALAENTFTGHGRSPARSFEAKERLTADDPLFACSGSLAPLPRGGGFPRWSVIQG